MPPSGLRITGARHSQREFNSRRLLQGSSLSFQQLPGAPVEHPPPMYIGGDTNAVSTNAGI